MQRLTIRLKPYSDESLLSYLLRMQKINGLPNLNFLRYITGKTKKYFQKSFQPQLDIPSSYINFDILSQVTGCSVEVLQNTTLLNALKVFCSSEELSNSRFISGLISKNLRYCPQCLNEKPYLRLIWRIKDIPYCLEHECHLLNSCIHCGKEISLARLSLVDNCPFCGGSLSKKSIQKYEHEASQKILWLIETWRILLSTREHINSRELCVQLLYIFSNFNEVFDRETVLNKISEGVLENLLQRVRGTFYNQVSVHLNFLFETLYQSGITIVDFFSLNVPDSFRLSLNPVNVKKVDQLTCQAPWCNSYHKPGSLTTTGTRHKRRKDGDVLQYFMSCTLCGCEYAIKNGELIERTYFIESYKKLLTLTDRDKTFGIKSYAKALNTSEEKILRVFAYFQHQNLFQDKHGKPFNIDLHILDKMHAAISNGIVIKNIEYWDCWDSYYHYLIHRFHPSIIKTLREIKRVKPNSQKFIFPRLNEQVQSVLSNFVKGDEDITIESVAKAIGISSENLRVKGYSIMIAEQKKIQQEIRLNKIKSSFFEKVDKYFMDFSTAEVKSEELYKTVGIKRHKLWRHSPEVTSYISERIREHNRNLI